MVFALGMSKRLAVVKLNQIQLQLHADGLLHKSQTDPLTGVANRAGLEAQTQALFANGGNHTLILLDLDKFKPVNDIHGHQAGDAVLITIAKRLHGMVRAHDLVARIGGDEFVLLLAHDHERSTLAPVVQRILKGIAQPVEFEGHTLSVGSSLGIATFPQDGRTLAELMHAADLAMYHVKKNGRGNFAFYEDTLTASPPGADTPSPAAKA